MNKKLFPSILWFIPGLLVTAFLLVGPGSAGAVPGQINYRGKLTDPAGQVLNGEYDIDFTLFTAVSGGGSVWNESHADVQVTNGLFNVMLGETSSLTDTVLTAASLWLELTVDGEALRPRQEVVGAGFALKASGFTVDPAGRVGIGTDNPESELHVVGEVKGSVGGLGYFMVPEQAVIMWSGALSAIPHGWQLCDGSNGTPDLRDRFVYGVGLGEDPGATAGSASHTHSFSDTVSGTTSSTGSHTHSYSTVPVHSHAIDPPSTTSSSAGSHSHSADPPSTSTTSSGYHSHTAPQNESYGTLNGRLGQANPNSGGTYNHYTNSTGNHSHSVNIGSFSSSAVGSHTHSLNIGSFTTSAAGSSSCATGSAGSHSHTLADNTASGDTSSNSTLPPYFKIAFITPVSGS